MDPGMFHASSMYQNAAVCHAMRPQENSRDCDLVLSIEEQRIAAWTLVGYNFVAMQSLTESASVASWKTGAQCSPVPFS